MFTHITWAAVLGAVHLFFLYNCPSTFVFWWTGSFDRNSTTAIDAFLVTLSRFLIPFTICNACRHQRIQITLHCMRSSGQAEEIHYKIQDTTKYKIQHTKYTKYRMLRMANAVFTRDKFTWGKLTFLLYCVTFGYCEIHLPHVSVSRVNTA